MRRAEHCYIGTGCIGLAHIVVGHTGWQAAGSIVVDYTLVVVAAPRPEVVAETTVAAVHIVLGWLQRWLWLLLLLPLLWVRFIIHNDMAP